MKLLTSVVSGVLAVALLSGACAAFAFTPQSEQDAARDFMYQPVTGLVAAVREATAKYQNVKKAVADGYGPVLGCVSGSDMGGMGVHYVNGGFLTDGVLDVAHPEALVYEPEENGHMQLVAVEYIVFADSWDSAHADGSAPALMGQLFDYSDAPNRFRLPAFYSLHVWAWKYNPAGVFSMWNPRVSCKDYTG